MSVVSCRFPNSITTICYRNDLLPTSWQLPRLRGSYRETDVMDFGHYETLKAWRGRVWREVSHSPADYKGFGERLKLKTHFYIYSLKECHLIVTNVIFFFTFFPTHIRMEGWVNPGPKSNWLTVATRPRAASRTRTPTSRSLVEHANH